MLRNKWMALLLLAAMMLSACSQAEAPIASPEISASAEASYKTVTVSRGTFSQIESCKGSFVYPDSKTIYCEYPNAILMNPINIRENSEIKAGELLATFTFGVSKAELSRLELAYSETVRAMNKQLAAYQATINALAQTALLDTPEGKLAAMQKQQTELDMQNYRIGVEQNLVKQGKALQDYRELFSEKTVIIPEDGKVMWSVEMTKDQVLAKDAPILTYYTEETRYLKVNSASEDFYEMAVPGTKVTIADNNNQIEGYVISAPAGIDEISKNRDVYIASEHFDELNSRSAYSVSCVVLELENMLLLDKKAIKKDGDIQYVYVIENGSPIRRNVFCGLEEEGIVCILDGLTEGQQVVIS